ncbi:MAG: type II secretion system F family protein [Candidatus Dojkabacteria bacterium]|nr:type II secretion system F family protein [Candidatus Dojkabacteria bacterium]
MQKYLYKALKNKSYVTGEIEGKDEDEVAGKLREKGLEILSIKVPKDERLISTINVKKVPLLKGSAKVKKSDKVFLYKNTATMLKAGLPLPEVIDLLRESLKSPKLVEILTQLKYDVEAGSYISSSLGKFPEVFGTNEIAMIKAGEAGGTLPESFQGLFQDSEAELNLQKDIRSALMYPIIILCILAVIAVALFVFVIPQLTGFFTQAGIDIPKMTRITMAISSFVKDNFIIIFAFIVISAVAFQVLIKKSPAGKKVMDRLILKIPFFGKQIKLFYIYKIARMLGLLIKSGVPILQALEIVQKSVTHDGYSKSIGVLRGDVKGGGKLSDSFDKFEDLYPPFVSRMLKVGDRTGNLADSLANVSEYYQKELQDTLKNLPSLIEPVLLLILGAGVAFIAISVLIPMYSIVSGINQISHQ